MTFFPPIRWVTKALHPTAPALSNFRSHCGLQVKKIVHPWPRPYKLTRFNANANQTFSFSPLTQQFMSPSSTSFHSTVEDTHIHRCSLSAKLHWNFMMCHKCHYTCHNLQTGSWEILGGRVRVGGVGINQSGAGAASGSIFTSSLSAPYRRHWNISEAPKKYLQRFYLFPEHIKNMTIQTSAPTTATQRKIQNKLWLMKNYWFQ